MKNLCVLIAAAVVLSCAANPEPEKEQTDGVYTNPVARMSLPDPTVMMDNGVFYLYATEDIRNVPIMCSPDLVNWKKCGTVFSDAARPNFVEGGGIWAPDVNRIGPGQYVLYYSMSVWGGIQTCGIGVAVADNPVGPWEDKGKMFISKEIGVTNSIDPCYFEEDGKKYLFWGSFNGIYAVELSDDALSVKEGAEPLKVAGSAYEGTYIHKRGKYYYMFASTGACCNGFNSTYKTVVGRSTSLFGPYVNRKGEKMLDNRHEILISGDYDYIGTGHNAEIVTDKAGTDWILYHAYCRDHSDRARTLMLDKVFWDGEDWPLVNKGTPTPFGAKPVF